MGSQITGLNLNFHPCTSSDVTRIPITIHLDEEHRPNRPLASVRSAHSQTCAKPRPLANGAWPQVRFRPACSRALRFHSPAPASAVPRRTLDLAGPHAFRGGAIRSAFEHKAHHLTGFGHSRPNARWRGVQRTGAHRNVALLSHLLLRIVPAFSRLMPVDQGACHSSGCRLTSSRPARHRNGTACCPCARLLRRVGTLCFS
jgi:hypothetical protein